MHELVLFSSDTEQEPWEPEELRQSRAGQMPEWRSTASPWRRAKCCLGETESKKASP